MGHQVMGQVYHGEKVCHEEVGGGEVCHGDEVGHGGK